MYRASALLLEPHSQCPLAATAVNYACLGLPKSTAANDRGIAEWCLCGRKKSNSVYCCVRGCLNSYKNMAGTPPKVKLRSFPCECYEGERRLHCEQPPTYLNTWFKHVFINSVWSVHMLAVRFCGCTRARERQSNRISRREFVRVLFFWTRVTGSGLG